MRKAARTTKKTSVPPRITPVEKPAEALVPPTTLGPGDLRCVICGKAFHREANNAVKAKICLPADAPHRKVDKVMADGSIRKVCECCRCVYKKTIGKQRSVDGKIIPLSRLKEFLKLTEDMYGSEILLSFRTAINAMLRVSELAGLQVGDLEPNARPLPQLHVVALKKKVKMRWPVDMDPEMLRNLQSYVGTRVEGPIFAIPVRTLQHKFKQVMKKMGLGKLSIHSLRHTGIANRAQQITNLNELNYLRLQARHESIETTKLYLGLEAAQRIEMAKKINWV